MAEFRLKTGMRQRSARVLGRVAEYCALGENQPLLLEAEPTNPADPNAVLCKDILGTPVGYIFREDAPAVATQLRSGNILLAKTVGPCLCVYRRVLVWSEGETVEEVEASIKRKPSKRRVKETTE